jgi:o-succinylbenzoate---CoA ligase
VSLLSIAAAAASAGDRPAIITATATLTFADCARLASELAPAPERVATPTIETVLAIYRALETAQPLALLHPRLTGDELDRQRAAVRAAELARDRAFVLFTSGSTGRARGVVLSRDAILAAAHASAARLGWRDDDRWLLCLPLAHAGGLSIVVRCLVARVPIVLLEGDFEPARVHALVRDHRATLASLVPAQLSALVTGGTHAPEHLRAVLLGGAAAAPALVASAVGAHWPVLPTYGLTETFGQIATATSPGGPPIVLPGVTIIAGETLRVRGPMLATAYLDGTAIAPELVTADLGTIDGEVLHVLGRRDDVIVTGGEKVHPLEIEAVLAATPGVRAACVFGLPDPRWGHVVAAALATDAGFSNAAALASWHATLPAHARPRRLAIVPSLPLLASGKLDRRTIAALSTVAVVYDRP